jgi:hypothetical protein
LLSSILVISQAANNVITVTRVPDDGIAGIRVSSSHQLSIVIAAIEDRLFSGIPAGDVLILRMDADCMTVYRTSDPGFTGQHVATHNTLTKIVEVIKDALYRER